MEKTRKGKEQGCFLQKPQPLGKPHPGVLGLWGHREEGAPWPGGLHYEIPEKVSGATGSPESKYTSANRKAETMWQSEFSKDPWEQVCSYELVQVSEARSSAPLPSW